MFFELLERPAFVWIEDEELRDEMRGCLANVIWDRVLNLHDLVVCTIVVGVVEWSGSDKHCERCDID